MWLNPSSAPGFSEQILLRKLRNELARSFDLSSQSAFEKALQKLERSAEKRSCLHLKCVMVAHAGFPHTSLFLLKSQPKYHRLTLVMIGENRQWRVKHEVCKLCGLTPEDRLTNIVLRMESYVRPPMAVEHMKPQTFSKSATLDSRSIVPEKPKAKIEEAKSLPEPEPQKSAESVVQKAKLPLEELQFKIAQRRYNQLIWKKIKKDLMFFRQKHRNQSTKNLKARLRLQIDQFGKVIERRLLKASGSDKFDKTILDSVDLLKLPPPMKLLIRHPPYVVTILIQP
ncbi:MAG: TonB C-terminal domain-containing protein [SAR324 cluster bacterium]|nr:TonB C-terminal domain-containing protein [SAR324 cluster bacterium]